MNGKGSRQRPVKDRKTFNKNWDNIFGNKNKTKTKNETSKNNHRRY
jgi:hypothetical protein